MRESDIVVIIRLGDFFLKQNHSVLPFSFYEEALSMTPHERVFICTDDTSDPFLKRFKKYNAVVCRTNPLSNLKLTMAARKIVISQSTFCWWAAFLSQAKEIYFPRPLEGFWSASEQKDFIDLRVVDEDRYIYVKCREKHRALLSERIIRLARKMAPLRVASRSWRG